MRIPDLRYLLVLILLLLAFACGNSDEKPPVIVSGTFSMERTDPAMDKPVVVAITNTLDYDVLTKQSRDAIIEIVTADRKDNTFRIDLTEKGVKAGDEVFILAFLDADYSGGVPIPTLGDRIGIYVPQDSISPAYTLIAGENKINIDINRDVYDYDASVSGVITGHETGPVTLVAYAGEINSSDFSDIDFNNVVGFATFEKGWEPAPYTLNILPYGRDLPIEGVKVFALLDIDRNRKINAGDRIGFYKTADADLLTPINLSGEGVIPGIDIEFTMDVPEPSGYKITVSGTLDIPDEPADPSPVYVAVFEGDDPSKFSDAPFSDIKYFIRIPAGEDDYTIDLSGTDLVPGDPVIIIALMDKDHSGGFPNLTPGDVIGFHLPADRITPAFPLIDGENNEIDIRLNRTVYDYDASISGTVTGSESGKITLVAYAGEIESSDFSTVDFDDVVGFAVIDKGADPKPYKIDILPYGKDLPIIDIKVFAVLDTNGNDEIDAGDRIGFYKSGDSDFLTTIDIAAEGEISGINFDFSITVPKPSGYKESISGSITTTGGSTAGAPVYVAVFDGNDPEQITKDPFAGLKYFTKIPAGQSSYMIDLSDTDLAPGDPVIVIGLWDKDFKGGFPNLTPGDEIGIYLPQNKLVPALTLIEGTNNGVNLDINRTVYDYDASISGTVTGTDSGKVTLVAYAGEIESSDFTALNFDDVIGFASIDKGAAPAAYRIDILPYGKNLPIKDVKVFALLDVNGNNEIDAGDRIGFYRSGDSDFLTTLNIDGEGEITGVDLGFSMTVPQPSGYKISISGTIATAGGSSAASPVYVAVFDGSDPELITNDPIAGLIYFTKIPAGQSSYTIDLSNTGLAPGDPVIVVGLWDKDFNGGFPNLTTEDEVGISIPMDTLVPALTLEEGTNSGVNLDINRTVYDYDASISGTITGTDSGKVTLVAYVGEIESSDFSAIDFEDVVGFTVIDKGTGSTTYTINILPYGKDLPIENVKVFALLDANDNDEIDAGDRIGFYRSEDADFLTAIDITGEGETSGIDLGFSMTVPEPSGYKISISGTISTAGGPTESSPVYVAVFDGEEPELIMEDMVSRLKYFTRIPAGQSCYTIDLSDTDLAPGDPVIIVGLWDKDYSCGFPQLTPGDAIGIYLPKNTLVPALTLIEGTNSGVNLDINRTVYDYDASISGTVTGTDSGKVTLVAYAGEIESSDFSAIDFEDVVGFTVIDKEASPAPYTIDILPYGKNLPIENVKVFALLDANGNDEIDAGDRIGFYRSEDADFLTAIDITSEGKITGINLGFSMTVPEPSGYKISISGTIATAGGPTESSPVYVAVFDGEEPELIMEDMVSRLKYFTRIPAGQSCYTIDLSDTDLAPGDPVIIVGLWDKDYSGGFPQLTPGDAIGIYLPKNTLVPALTLIEGTNNGVNLDINRTVYDYDASISGTVTGTDPGKVTLVAYAGEIESSDFSAIDFEDVVGFTVINKEAAPAPYTIDILPYGKNLPIKDVKVFALLDVNGNNEIDAGDRIGFYRSGDSDFLTTLNIDGEEEITGVDLGFSMTVPQPSGYKISISGTIATAGGSSAASPVYVAVFDGSDPELITNDPIAGLIYFTKIPAGQSSYTIDLSNTGLAPGDPVIVVGLWDKDFNGGFPNLTTEDEVGISIPIDTLVPALTLEEGTNSGVNLDINRTVYDYDASITGTIGGTDAGKVTLVAYAGEIESSDFSAIDFEDVVGFTVIDKGTGSTTYTINILPYGKDLPIENVKVFALLDANGNDEIDAGDRIGFYRSEDADFLTAIDITGEGETSGIDLGFSMTVPEPSGYKISISGTISTAGGPTESSPVYVAVFDGEEPELIMEDMVSRLKYFTRIPAGQSCYTIDLSDTDLAPGDPVIIVGLWDKDYSCGFPQLTPGDAIGIYLPKNTLVPALTLIEGTNSGVNLDINRTVYDYDASISGTVTGTDSGKVTLVAYAGEIESSDFSAIDFEDVVGFTVIDKEASPATYTIDILPYGKNLPIENVKVFALLDANGNDLIDNGDRIGIYKAAADDFLTTLTISGEGEITGIDLGFSIDIPEPSGYNISISGCIETPESPTDAAPVYVAVFDGSDPAQIAESPFAGLKYFTKIPVNHYSYYIDLSRTDLVPGDRIMVIGLWDRDHSGGFPNLTPGDAIGLNQPQESLLPAHVLTAGENKNIDLKINRTVYDYDASISGTITGSESGKVMLVAYAGEIESSDFTALNFDDVIGFASIDKGAAPAAYRIGILPYGKNLPIKDVKIFALLDVNRNDAIDAGDRIGFYKASGDTFLTPITISGEGEIPGINFGFSLTVPEPSGYDIILSGDIDTHGDTSPTYVAVFEGSDPARIATDPILGLKYFSRIPAGEDHYTIDLSTTELEPGDLVIVVVFSDRDHSGGIPNLNPGDAIGFYLPINGITAGYPLSDGRNTGLDIDVNRTVYDYQASFSGTILGNDPGTVTLVAYCGEIISSDFRDLNVDDIIGFGTIEKGTAPVPYTLDILPFGRNLPISNVRVFAILDADRDKAISGGDKLGTYRKAGETFSSSFTIASEGDIPGIDITFILDIPVPSGDDISIAGAFSIPQGYFEGDAPVFVTVFRADEPNNILADPLTYMSYFYKIPPTDFFFDRDLSQTGLKRDDEVMILALWDKDYNGGFPEPTPGDKIGLVQNKDTYQFTMPLTLGKNIVPPEGYEFKINKRLYDFDAEIDFALDMSNTGNYDPEIARIIVVVIHVEGFSFTVYPSTCEFDYTIDMDYLLGVSILPGTTMGDFIGIGERSDPDPPRKLPILTALFDQLVVWPENEPPLPLIKGDDQGEPLERTAYLLAILDKNGNSQLDGDDEIGYYSNKVIEVNDENNTIDIPIIGQIVIPPQFYGSFSLPTPIPRITSGINRETREDGSTGPYWITMSPVLGTTLLRLAGTQ